MNHDIVERKEFILVHLTFYFDRSAEPEAVLEQGLALDHLVQAALEVRGGERGQEAQPAEVHPEDRSIVSHHEPCRPQEGTVPAQRDDQVDRIPSEVETPLTGGIRIRVSLLYRDVDVLLRGPLGRVDR